MKNLKTTLSILVVFTFLIACDQQEQATPTLPKFVEVAIPDAYKSGIGDHNAFDDDVDDVILNVKLTTADGKAVDGKVHLIIPDDGSLMYLAMTENMLNTATLTPDFLEEALRQHDPNARQFGSQGCFAGCRDMKKGQGKGTCKALCWLEIIKDVVSAIATVLIVSQD